MATIALSLCGFARAETLLSAAELERVMVGNTVRFQNLVTGSRGLTYFDPDGTALVGDQHVVFVATWRIEPDGTHCVTLDGAQRCARVRRNDDGTHSPVSDGKPVMTWLAVTQGKTPGAFAPVASDRVSFPSLTFSGATLKPFMPPVEEGASTRVNGILALPPGDARTPAVVIVHGCGGIGSGQYAWAGTLNRIGIATLIVDSFRNRNIREICTGKQTINVASAIADAYHALDFLAANPRIDASRIAILGASFGGRAALWTSNQRIRERYGKGSARFAAHLGLYPASCYITLADETNVGPAPIRVLHGSADDWIPVGPCRQYVERLRRAGRDAALLEYPGAHHGFDMPHLPAMRVTPEAINPTNCVFLEKDGRIIDQASGGDWDRGAACLSRGTSAGYDPEAHRKAITDVTSFLKTLFRLD